MPLSPSEVASALAKRGYAEPEARAVAATAEGSLSRALEVDAGDLMGARNTAAAVLRQVARDPGPKERLNQAKALLEKRSGKKGSMTAAAFERELLASNLRAMSSLLRDVELLASGVDEQWLANRDVSRDLERLRDVYAGGRSRAAFAAVDRALSALDRNASAKIVADWVVLQI
jgi:hypothetical protein